ncbi:hypothetical protein [Actinoplanes siamensis]|uniref:Uncharacterized protein n=1 Tax=Actinoplanes siamensis TaxID=1223317 RepID=A0A919N6T2_9ACTN|nr:hypothetical protein [Actinoplanes siamensis]GIF05402.1 hypothetical protein Asi03nite_29400 [Actinoplanes siamensis]
MPARLRGDLFALVPIIVASWALGGLYLSLGPSVASDSFGIHDHLAGGLVVALVCGTGAVTSFLLRRVATARVLTVAGGGLLAGGALGVAGLMANRLGLHTTALWYAGIVAVLGLVALIAQRARHSA